MMWQSLSVNLTQVDLSLSSHYLDWLPGLIFIHAFDALVVDQFSGGPLPYLKDSDRLICLQSHIYMQWTMQGDQICHIWSWPCFGSHKPLFSDPILRDRGKPDPKHCQLQSSDLELIFRCRINQTLSDQNWRVYTGFCVNSVFGHWAAKPSTNADQEQLFFWPLPSFYHYLSSKMPPVWLLKVQFLIYISYS